MALHPVRETRLCIYRPCLLDREPLRTLISRNAATDQWERAEYSRTTFRRQTVGGGGGVYYTSPSLPIFIKYKQEGVGIRVSPTDL
jgi:hypothetical protein